MRKAAALPLALVACFSCTYNIPDLVSTESGGAGGGDDASSSGASGDGGSGADTMTSDGASSGGDVASATDSHGGSPQDATGAADGPCRGLLCACATSTDCASDICADSATVGSSLYMASGSFCTSPCCTSADCGAGGVCFDSGQGGSYCVSPAWLGRGTTTGSSPGGASCSQDAQCRSALCTGGSCADTCCSLAGSATECSAQEQCAFGAFPGRVSFDQHFGARCGTPSAIGLGYGESCGNSSQCAGGLCVSGGCTNPCHDPNECGAGSACQLGIQSGDVYVACFPWNGTAPEGASCSSNSECKSDWCLDSNLCSGLCFTDADCASGWHCRPQPDTTPGGTAGGSRVLACAP